MSLTSKKYLVETLIPVKLYPDNFSDVLEGAELTYDPVAETAVDVTVIIGQNSLAIG